MVSRLSTNVMFTNNPEQTLCGSPHLRIIFINWCFFLVMNTIIRSLRTYPHGQWTCARTLLMLFSFFIIAFHFWVRHERTPERPQHQVNHKIRNRLHVITNAGIISDLIIITIEYINLVGENDIRYGIILMKCTGHRNRLSIKLQIEALSPPVNGCAPQKKLYGFFAEVRLLQHPTGRMPHVDRPPDHIDMVDLIRISEYWWIISINKIRAEVTPAITMIKRMVHFITVY